MLETGTRLKEVDLLCESELCGDEQVVMEARTRLLRQNVVVRMEGVFGDDLGVSRYLGCARLQPAEGREVSYEL